MNFLRHKWILVVVVLLFIGCSSNTGQPVNNDDSNHNNDVVVDEVEEVIPPTELLIWSFTDEILTELEEFEQEHNVKFTVEIQEINGFAPMAAGVIKSGEGGPDIIVCDEETLHNEQIEALLLNLDELVEANNGEELISGYVLEKGKDVGGKIIGLSYEQTPVGIFYRRDFAKYGLGLEEPEDVSAFFSDYNQMLEGAAKLKASNIRLFGDLYTLRHFAKPEMAREFIEFTKAVQWNEYVAFTTEWSDPWLSGMSGPVSVESGTTNVFAYVLPNWALSNIIMLVSDSEEVMAEDVDNNIKVYNQTSGDWAVAMLEDPRYVGSSYIGINSDTDNPTLCEAFVEYMVFDSEHLEEWLASSDIVSSHLNINSIQSFELGNEFLGGQDYQKVFGSIGSDISAIESSKKQVDDSNKESLIEVFYNFIAGEYHTVDEAYKDYLSREVILEEAESETGAESEAEDETGTVSETEVDGDNSEGN